MAITAFTGPPGAGKSHALVKDVIIPAVLKGGRRVLTNIDGIDPDAIYAYCLDRVDDVAQLGQVVTFDGADSLKPGFWPDEDTGTAATVVKGGDLVVFDEWALYYPRRGAWPQGSNVEKFLRWHRHLTGEGGQATDVAIGTQLATDVHQNVRGLIARSYKFRKATALGADGVYSWFVYEGHLQPKGGHYQAGTGKYDREVFSLYASSSAAKEGKHVELRTNAKDTIWSGWKAKAAIVVPVVLIGGGALALWSVFTDKPAPVVDDAARAMSSTTAGAPRAPAGPPASPFRIVGHIEGDDGMRVIVADDKGGVRVMRPDSFEFDQGRPIAGTIDGQRAVAEERLPINSGVPAVAFAQ